MLKTKTTAAALTALLLAVFTVLTSAGVCAAESTRLFTDVAGDEWFYSDIKTLVNKKVVSGYPDGTFCPDADVARSEALKLVMAAAGLDVSQPASGDWYSLFLAAALKSDFVGADFVKDIEGPAGRAETAELIVKVFDLGLTVIPENYHPFADTDDKNAVILSLCGIVKGEEENGAFVFHGERSLSRAELCALVLRLMRRADSERSLLSNPLPAPANDSVTNFGESECMEIFAYMATNRVLKYEFNALSLPDGAFDELFLCFEYAARIYTEYLSPYDRLEISASTSADGVQITLNLVSSLVTGGNPAYLVDRETAALEKAEEIYKTVYDSLPAKASQTDTAKALLEYIIDHCEYGESGNSISCDAFACLVEGKAICSGYTSAYNMLLKRAGIECAGVCGNVGDGLLHIWTLHRLDGVWSQTDSTYSDPVLLGNGEYINDFEYFNISEEKMDKDHNPDLTEKRIKILAGYED